MDLKFQLIAAQPQGPPVDERTRTGIGWDSWTMYGRLFRPRRGRRTTPTEGFLVAITAVEQDGQLVASELRVTPEGPRCASCGGRYPGDPCRRCGSQQPPSDVPPGGLDSSHLRAISLRRALGLLWSPEVQKQMEELGLPFFSRRASRRLVKSAREKQQGRERDEDYYADIALRYLAALATSPTRPIRAMVDEFRGQGVEYASDRVRDWVHLARRRGFLTESRKGVAGAQPTDKLRAWQRAHRGGRGRRKG